MKKWVWILILAVVPFSLSGCAVDEKARQKATLHYQLGLQQTDPTSALREFLEAEKLNPNDENIHFALGRAYNAKGRYLEGLEHFQRSLEINPKFTDARNAIGATYLELGKWDEAIREFNLVLNDILYLTPFYVHNNIGWAYYKKGNFSKAIEHYKKALGMKPDFGLAHYNLAIAYKDLKQTEQAILSFRQVTELQPDFAEAHFQLGQLYFEAGKNSEAQKSFEEVVRIAPQSENARLAQQYLDLLKKSAK